jgi:hypothetical protein
MRTLNERFHSILRSVRRGLFLGNDVLQTYENLLRKLKAGVALKTQETPINIGVFQEMTGLNLVSE